MLGRDHALSGALAFAALAPAMHLSGGYLVTGITVAAGAGVLPDIDHPDSSIALTFGFITNSFSWLIEKASGGHRHLTHAIPGIALFTAGAYTAGRYQLSGPHPPYASPGSPAWHPALFWHLVPAGIFLTLLYAAALRALKVGGHHGDIIAMTGAGATIYFGSDLQVITLHSWHVPLIGVAVGIGCVAHVIGDELTHGGCPLLYPVSGHEFHLLPRPLQITTAKIAETYVIFPVLALALGFAIWRAVLPRGSAPFDPRETWLRLAARGWIRLPGRARRETARPSRPPRLPQPSRACSLALAAPGQGQDLPLSLCLPFRAWREGTLAQSPPLEP